MTYDKDDALCESLEAVIDSPLQSGFVWHFSSSSPILNFEREAKRATHCNPSLCILRPGERHKLLIDNFLQFTFHWQHQIGFV